ncbi:phage distal tail protein [Streptomyces sp. NPDC021100]|uniref:phage distal tail protein n=1 Tax=Streptomyces sp. NPDC021100 TaxID=3365114 RepID=UPI0037B95B0E
MAGERVTRPGHIQIGDDLLLGPGTPYGWRSLTGWEESPGLDSGTVARADAHGGFPGRLLAQPRTITVEGLVVRTEPGLMGAAVRDLAAATALRDDEQPLVVQLDAAPPLMCYARCIRRAIPVEAGGYAVGVVVGGALQFEATDPRRYSVVEQTIETRLPQPEPGLDWHLAPGPEHLAWPLEFGTPGSTGTMTAVNSGDAPAHPTVSFRGPVELPSLTNITTGEAIEYDIALGDGDVLVVDTAAGTVVLNGSASRLHTVTARSTPEQHFVITPGTSMFAFRAAPWSTDPRAACGITWRSAHW